MNSWWDGVTEWWWDRLDRVRDWRLDRTDRVADWWWDRLDGLDERRDRITAKLASWPLAYKMLAGAALLVLVGFLILGQVGLERGRPPNVVADGPSTSGVPVLPVNLPDSTAAPLLAPTATSSTTALLSAAATSSTTVTPTTAMGAATTTTPSPTTAPPFPTTTRAPAGASPPSTGGQLASFCGFVPGAAVVIEVNGEPAGHETADQNGCVVVIRQLQPAP